MAVWLSGWVPGCSSGDLWVPSPRLALTVQVSALTFSYCCSPALTFSYCCSPIPFVVLLLVLNKNNNKNGRTFRCSNLNRKVRARASARQVAWLTNSLHISQVVEVHSLSGYEKSVMTVNEWIKTHGYEPFAEIVEVEPQRYKLQLLADDGVPRVPEEDAIIEFFIGMKTGEVEKGGSRALRDTDVYASPMWGKTQAQMFMPADKKGVRGWGAKHTVP